MKGFLGLGLIVVIAFAVGGPLGFLVLGSLIGLVIKSFSRRRPQRA